MMRLLRVKQPMMTMISMKKIIYGFYIGFETEMIFPFLPKDDLQTSQNRNPICEDFERETCCSTSTQYVKLK